MKNIYTSGPHGALQTQYLFDIFGSESIRLTTTRAHVELAEQRWLKANGARAKSYGSSWFVWCWSLASWLSGLDGA